MSSFVAFGRLADAYAGRVGACDGFVGGEDSYHVFMKRGVFESGNIDGCDDSNFRGAPRSLSADSAVLLEIRAELDPVEL